MFKEGMARSMNFNWCLGEAWPDPLTLPLPEKYLKKMVLFQLISSGFMIQSTTFFPSPINSVALATITPCTIRFIIFN
jgi:hypothetical protein